VLVVAVMVALTAGWPLVNLAISNRQPVPAGRTMSLGPDRADSARFTVGRGWSLRSSATDPRQSYVLRRGNTEMSLMYVTMSSRSQAPHLWSGMREILRLASSGARLSKPEPITSAQGRKGLTGTITENGRRGRVTIYLGPGGTFAIEIISLAPAHASPASRALALREARSITFPAARR
jgi:hypothetical protein